MFHSHFLEHLQQRLSDFFSEPTFINNHVPVHGGDINQAFMLDTSKGKFLIKINAAMFGLDMFEKEARGLLLLAETGCIKVPRPLFDGKYHQQIFLVMEYFNSGNPVEHFWDDFGEKLARLHQHGSNKFGLDYTNYIGKLVQPNEQHQRWADFYAQQRILYLANKALSKGLLGAQDITGLQKLAGRFDDLFPNEPPSLLHGDLWSGNFMVSSDGLVAIYDPAVYYGNREMDIAMTLLFNGFDRKFYDAYHYHFPLLHGWRDRVELCQLYPLLVHLILFGGHYHGQVLKIIHKYQ